jgi:hypothetical protein
VSARPRRGALALAAAGLLGYLAFSHTTFLVPDSAGTYAWSRSLLYDHDVDFRAEYARLGSIEGDERVRFSRPGATGLPGNPFGMGSGILWLPFVTAAEVLLRLSGEAVRPGGYCTSHLLAASAGTALYGIAALLLSGAVARRLVGSGAAIAAVAAVGFGTPFLAYLYHLPTYAHVNAAFGAAVTLVAAWRARRDDTLAGWGLAGAAAGFAAVIRAQHVVLLVIPLALLAARRRQGGNGVRVLLLLTGAAAVFSVQLAAWSAIYGSPFEIPQGGEFLDLARPALARLLFSPWHGLFPWAPVLLLVGVGLPLLWRRDPALAAGVGVALLGEIYVAAAATDWWAGYSFGARRLVDLTPLWAVAIAPAFEWTGRRWGRATAAGIAAAAIALNLVLTAAVRMGEISPFREIGAGELLRGAARAAIALPAYLGREVLADRTVIQFVVHRDAPAPPTLDAAGAGVIALTLVLCWLLGLAFLVPLARTWDDDAEDHAWRG